MKSILSMIAIALIAGITTWWLPWWMVCVSAFTIAVVMKHGPRAAFSYGFLGIALLWFTVALYRDIPNEHILSGRMATVFGLPNGHLFITVVTVFGGLLGGLSGWCGGLMNKAFRK